MDKQAGADKWRQFFSAMADGLLPYLHLYVKRNQRGGGIGNFKTSRQRYQVPIVVNGAALLGRGTSSTSSGKSMQLVTPTQQTVEQAKSIMKHEDATFQEMTQALKRKGSKTRTQNKKKRRAVQNKLTNKLTTDKNNHKKKQSRSKSFTQTDIFTRS